MQDWGFRTTAGIYTFTEQRLPDETPQREVGHHIFVIDRSGSMSGEPLAAVRRAAQDVVARLGPQDRLSLVAFDDEAEVLLDAVPMDDAGKVAAQERIAAIEPRSCTNLSAGWLLGARCVAGAMGGASAIQSRVILLSDGHANRGMRDAASLRSHAEQLRLRGLFTSTVGIGDGYDPALLQSLAEHGGGRLHDAERPQEIVEVVLGELSDCRATVADDVALTLTFPSTLRPLLLGVFPQRPVTLCPPECRAAEVTLGPMTAQSERHAVFRLEQMPGGPVGSALRFELGVTWRGEDGATRSATDPNPVKLEFALGRPTREQRRDDGLTLIAAQAWQAFVIQRVVAAKEGGSLESARRLLQREIPELARLVLGVPGADRLVAELRLLEELLPEQWAARQGIDLRVRTMQTLRSQSDHRTSSRGSWGERT